MTTTIYSITGAVLYESDKPLKETLEEAVAEGVSLKFAQLDGANLAGANLSRADLHAADLSEANLTQVGASYANFAYANLSEACLRNVSFYGANLLYATLTNTNITYASVNYAIFNPFNLKGATFNNHTIISAAACGPSGSRNDKLLALLTDNGLFFQTGCFFGTKEELLAAVESTHPDSQHGRDYRLAADFLETYLKG